ncbi:pyroglutamyl-peptidase I [Vallitalea okinawensis]|uniref:pyroglutamyl-peptidase I n=1 Tax=Vallitalea okinawensis TaxID=2078660 RepID=UPI000CFD6AE4|nr:pyroglutamyl-peptidase I [Vallitalea okinawensis]
MKALVTGFEPFGGEAINPAFEAVNVMKDEIGSCQVVKQELPTVFNQSLEVLEEAIEKEQPDIVICVGQAGGRFGLSLERVGINLNEARIPDNAGQQPMGEPIKEDGENAYFSNLPNKAILKELTENNIPASLSYTAGTYVCNHVLYGLMYMIQKKYTHIRGGFIHVPFLPEQTLMKRNTPFMSLDMIVKGLEIAVKITIDNKEDIILPVGETH